MRHIRRFVPKVCCARRDYLLMTSSYIIAGCRTPIGRLLGGLSSLPAPRLGAVAVAEAVRRAGLPIDAVEEVIMGNVLSAGLGQAPARQAAIFGGLPETVAALTINKMCGSGLKAVMLADQAIRAGDCPGDRGGRHGEHEPCAVSDQRGAAGLEIRRSAGSRLDAV